MKRSGSGASSSAKPLPRSCGIDEDDRACKEVGLVGRIPHDFRRTAARNLVRAGVPERVAMDITGHKTREVFDRYNIVAAGDLELAAKKIDERIASRTATILATTPLDDTQAVHLSQ